MSNMREVTLQVAANANSTGSLWSLYYKWRRFQYQAEKDHDYAPYAYGIFKRFADELEIAIEKEAALRKGRDLDMAANASEWLTPEFLLEVLQEYCPNAAKAMGWQTLKQIAEALAMPGDTKVRGPSC